MTIGKTVYVCESRIPNAGLGLFATQFFAKNAVITSYDGESITYAEARKRSVQTHMASREGVIIDGLKVPREKVGGGSFANGSPLVKHANATIVAQLGKLMLRASRNIVRDEEIIVHYGRRGFKVACGEEELR